jgi:hypothetical protein
MADGRLNRKPELSRDPNGARLTVAERNIIRAQPLLAYHDGIFAKPASAASAAGLIRARKTSLIGADDRAVCIITWHGLKDQKAVKSDCQVAISWLLGSVCQPLRQPMRLVQRIGVSLTVPEIFGQEHPQLRGALPSSYQSFQIPRINLGHEDLCFIVFLARNLLGTETVKNISFAVGH